MPWATPVVSGHLTFTATLSKSRHTPTLNYLRSADTCLTRTRTFIYWLSVPVITDSSNKCRVLVVICDQQFAEIPMLPSGDRNQCFISQTHKEWPQRAIVAEWNSGGRPDIKYVERQKSTYIVFAYCTILQL